MLLSLVAFVAVAVAKPTPFDFTGHWAGSATQKGLSAAAVADFAGTGTFTGTIGVDLGQLVTCTTQGKQRHRVVIALSCSDGSKGKMKARLDPTTRTLTGRYHSHRRGHHPQHGTFILTSPGACVPAGQDCTDPATGGGEAAVCCGSDCQGVVNPDNTQSHTCL